MKLLKFVLCLGLIVSLTVVPVSSVWAFTGTFQCQDNTWGSNATTATTNDRAIHQMVCNARNLVVGLPGKVVGTLAIGFGFGKATGLIGNQGGVWSAVLPMLFGTGLAFADELSTAVGYEFN